MLEWNVRINSGGRTRTSVQCYVWIETILMIKPKTKNSQWHRLLSLKSNRHCVLFVRNHSHMHTHGHKPYRDNEASLLEVLDEGNCVLLEVGQAPVNGLGVIIWSSLLLSSFVQPFLQAVVGAGQKHHQVRGADLAENVWLVRDVKVRPMSPFIYTSCSQWYPTGSWVSRLQNGKQEVRRSRPPKESGFYFHESHTVDGKFVQDQKWCSCFCGSASFQERFMTVYVRSIIFPNPRLDRFVSQTNSHDLSQFSLAVLKKKSDNLWLECATLHCFV